MQKQSDSVQQAQSHTKALDRLATGQMQVDTQVSSKQASSELGKMQQTKKEDRKIEQKQLDYIMNSFEINKIKASNILRRLTLKQAIQYLLEN